MANWDVIGTAGGDNIRLGYDGQVYRLDNGGALRFRARGAKKGNDFGETVGELSSLRAKNEVFSDISDEEIERQIVEILEGQDRIFTAIDIATETMGLPAEALEEVRLAITKRLEYLRVFVESKRNREKKTDKGIYESVTTNNYFEGWDKLGLEGNDGIKDKIRENIMRVETRNQGDYETMATDLGISVEEFKARLQAKVEDMVNKADFFRATDMNVLKKVMLSDGRWKSQFETGRSNGSLDPSYRAASEIVMFGFNETEGVEVDYGYGSNIPKEILEQNKEKRPIYGYFSDDEHGGINSENGKIPPPRMYVIMELLILR